MYRLTGKHRQAFGYLSELISSDRDAVEAAEARLLLGDLCIVESKWKQAIGHLENAIALGERHGWERPFFNGNIGLSTIYRRIGAYEESVKYASQALDFANSNGRRDRMAVAYLYLCISQVEMGEKSKARKTFELAKALSEEIKPLRDRVIQWYHLGVLLRFLGDVKGSMEYSEKSAAISKDFGEIRLYAHNLLSLSYCYHITGETSRGEIAARDGIKIARLVEDGNLLAHFEGMLAGILDDEGRHAEAERLFRKSLESLKMSGQTYYYATTLARYIAMLIKLRDPKAGRLLSKCRKLYESISSRDGLRQCDSLMRKMKCRGAPRPGRRRMYP
jgi:tetratricopeptide (TPR) repeat protein